MEAERQNAPPADGQSDRAERAEILAVLAEKVRPVALAGEHQLPVLDPLSDLVTGLRRGSTVEVVGPASTSLMMALAAGPSQAGSWVAAIGFQSLGLVAADGMGVCLERLVMVADPPSDQLPAVVAAVVDSFDIVLLRGDMRPSAERRLAARVRERGAVLVRSSTSGGPAADVTLEVLAEHWEGLDHGHGHLRARRVEIRSSGRRQAARARSAVLWLPAADGGVAEALDDPIPIRSQVPAGA